MTHTTNMPESAGTFDQAQPSDRPCRKCGKAGGVTYRVWESHCGAYVDEKFTCSSCGHTWWVEGIDS